jgi:hypothetical protein
MDPPIRMKDHISHLKRKRSKNRSIEESELSEMKMIPNYDSKNTFVANDLNVHDDNICFNRNLSSTSTSTALINKQFVSNHFKSKSKDSSLRHHRHHHHHHHHHSNHVQPNNNNLYYNLKRENSSFSQATFEGSNEILTIKSDVITLKNSLHLILKELCIVTNKVKENENYEDIELMWKFAAMVIDRLCMVVFSILTIMSTASILFTSTNFFSNSDPDPKY